MFSGLDTYIYIYTTPHTLGMIIVIFNDHPGTGERCAKLGYDMSQDVATMLLNLAPGKLTVGPCQIGFGRLVSMKNG